MSTEPADNIWDEHLDICSLRWRHKWSSWHHVNQEPDRTKEYSVVMVGINSMSGCVHLITGQRYVGVSLSSNHRHM